MADDQRETANPVQRPAVNGAEQGPADLPPLLWGETPPRTPGATEPDEGALRLGCDPPLASPLPQGGGSGRGSATLLRCPYCREPLSREGRAYRCSRGHAFDIARQGYVNLLPPFRRHSRQPGDSRDMIQARRRFLDGGYYDRIAEEVNHTVATELRNPPVDGARAILDAGSGEGFYLAHLRAHLAGLHTPGATGWYGVDISRYGMQYATHRSRDITWLVASLVDLPLPDAALDVMLSIFAPSAAAEFHRLLRSGGALVVVAPGPSHLYALRRLLYRDVLPQTPDRLLADLAGRFTLHTESRVAYDITLPTAEVIRDLLTMTPFGWNIDAATRALAEAAAPLTTPVEAGVRLFRKA